MRNEVMLVIDAGNNRVDKGELASSQRGFSLTELMIALLVFIVIIGSVVTLLVKSQKIFRTEQGVSEMDQNARLLVDFITRDIQQAKENSLGLGTKFRSIYSYNGPEGRTDEMTIVSSDTETKIPARALPFIAATTTPFSAGDHYVEILPNGAGHMIAAEMIESIEQDEEMVISGLLPGGAVQFDFIKVKGTKILQNGAIGLTFEPVSHRGVDSDIPFGSTYENGAFTLRPVTIKRYFVDRHTDPGHPMLALSINDSDPIPIARNIVAFQLRYLEAKDGDVEGRWVTDQSLSRDYTTLAVEVTLTGRTEIEDDKDAERLVTLATVVRPRIVPGGDTFGSSNGGTGSPGFPDGGTPGVGRDGNGGGGGGDGDPGDGFGGGPGGYGSGGSGGYGTGNDSGLGGAGYDHRTRYIGKQPRLGERLNPPRR